MPFGHLETESCIQQLQPCATRMYWKKRYYHSFYEDTRPVHGQKVYLSYILWNFFDLMTSLAKGIPIKRTINVKSLIQNNDPNKKKIKII